MEINSLILEIISILIILLVAFLIIKLVFSLIRKGAKRFDVDVTVIQVLQETIKYVIYVFTLIIILEILGINITGIVLSLGIVGVAVGFAARDTISNYISGFFVLADKSFKVGDIIEISNQKGKIVKIGFRITTIISQDNKIITIPNSLFSKNPHVNYTASEGRRVDLNITIPYDIQLENVINSLENVAARCKWVLDEPKPKVLVNELSDTGIRAVLNIWVDDPWKVDEYRSSLAKEVKRLLYFKNL
jgi:small conductance mechanosensitive channel